MLTISETFNSFTDILGKKYKDLAIMHWPLFIITILMGLVYVAFNLEKKLEYNSTTAFSDIFPELGVFLSVFLVGILISFIVTGAVIVYVIAQLDKKPLNWRKSYKVLFSRMNNYFMTSFITSLIIFGGLLLFVVPGFYFMFRYGLAPYIALDKNKPPKEALKEASQLYRGKVGYMFSIGLLMMAIAVFLSIFTSILTILPLVGDIIGSILDVLITMVSTVLMGVAYVHIRNAGIQKTAATKIDQNTKADTVISRKPDGTE